MVNDRLKELRTSLGLNRREFARELNVNYSTYTGYEQGAREPGSDFLSLVARKYSVTADWLIGLTEERARPLRSISAGEMALIARYRKLDVHARRLVDAVLDSEEQRLRAESESASAPESAGKVIPLFGNSFAAGSPEPDFGNMWTDHIVPSDSRAQFAIKVNGNSMEPWLPDGSIALGRKDPPRDGDVAALWLDGEFLVKQVCQDMVGNLYLFSLNRERKDADVFIAHDSERSVMCFGTIIMDKRPPLPSI